MAAAVALLVTASQALAEEYRREAESLNDREARSFIAALNSHDVESTAL